MKPWFSAPLVCGVDFSRDSARALVFAGGLASRLGQPLTVVTAADPLLVEAADLQYGPGQFMEQAQDDLQEFVEHRAPGATTEVEIGDAARVLLGRAVAQHAGLIVVGTHGLGRAERALLGSTTLRLMRAADRPVLAIPPPERDDGPELDASRVDRLVCGVDFSDASLVAARAAVALGSALSVPVVLVHAVPELTVPPPWQALALPSTREREAETHLDALAAGFTPVPGTVVRTGSAPQALSAEAGSDGQSVIVMGIRGAGRHRPGSTALRALATARVPVLAVPEG